MRYRLAQITLAAALAAGVAPIVTAPASANCETPAVCSCSDPDACACVTVGPANPCLLVDYVHPSEPGNVALTH